MITDLSLPTRISSISNSNRAISSSQQLQKHSPDVERAPKANHRSTAVMGQRKATLKTLNHSTLLEIRQPTVMVIIFPNQKEGKQFYIKD